MADTATLARLHPLDAAQRDRLSQIHTFLTNITDTRIARRAYAYGYHAEAHKRGVAAHRTAAGLDRPFGHFVAEAAQVAAGKEDELKARLLRVDTFENHLFPTVANSIRSEIPESHRTIVEEALFAGISQQPLGPGVLTSTRTLLDRLEQLGKRDDIPGLAALYTDLHHKGIGKADIAKVLSDIAAAEEPAPAPEAPAIPDEEIEAANTAQTDAFEKLNAWYIGWADHLRGRLPYHDAVRLGITQVKGGRGAAPTETPAEG